jgi:hypothetical protein
MDILKYRDDVMEKLDNMPDEEFMEVLKKAGVKLEEKEETEVVEETWTTEKEKIFDQKIKPLLNRIEDICNDNEIQYFSTFGLGGGEKRYTATSVNEIDEENVDYNPLIKAADDIVHYRNDNEFVMKYVNVIRDLVKCYGFSSESQEERLRRIIKPRVGDLVVEHTNPYSSINSIGKIVGIKDGEYWKEYNVKLFDGRTITWGNAGFYRIPIKEEALDW